MTENNDHRNRLAVEAKRRADPASLVGSYFHGEGDKWRGHHGAVVAEPSPGIYLCEFFDWFVGASDHQQLVRIEDMIGWRIYDDAYWMAYENGVRRRWDHERGEEEEPGKLVPGGEFIHGAKADD